MYEVVQLLKAIQVDYCFRLFPLQVWSQQCLLICEGLTFGGMTHRSLSHVNVSPYSI